MSGLSSSTSCAASPAIASLTRAALPASLHAATASRRFTPLPAGCRWRSPIARQRIGPMRRCPANLHAGPTWPSRASRIAPLDRVSTSSDQKPASGLAVGVQCERSRKSRPGGTNVARFIIHSKIRCSANSSSTNAATTRPLANAMHRARVRLRQRSNPMTRGAIASGNNGTKYRVPIDQPPYQSLRIPTTSHLVTHVAR